MRHSICLLACVLFLTFQLYGQIPHTISYQGVLTDSLGNPKPDNSYDLTFRLYGAMSSGTALWTETKSLQVKWGLFSTILGDQTPLPDMLRFDRPYWLSLQVGGNPELTPRLPLTAVGYSLYSLRADTAKFAIAAPQAAFVDSARVAGALRVGASIVGVVIGGPILHVENHSGSGVEGVSPNDFAIHGTSTSSYGIYGESSNNTAVVGESNTSAGVRGSSTSDAGVIGNSDKNDGMRGEASADGTSGVYGVTNNSTGFGVRGLNGSGVGVFGSSENGYGVRGVSTNSDGVRGEASADGASAVYGVTNNSTGFGVFGLNGSGTAVCGNSTNGDGVRGVASAASKSGVFGETVSNAGGAGVLGQASTTTGFADGVSGKAYAINSTGGRFTNDGEGIALFASSNGNTVTRTTLRVHNNSNTYGMAAYLTNTSSFHTAHFQNSGSGGVLFLQNNGDGVGSGGNDFITAVDNDGGDVQFKVLSSGEVRSDVGFNTPAADFAEMLPAAEGLQAGDILVIGDEGKLILSTAPYQTIVAGVYSTQPGFTGGRPIEGDIVGTVPLAISGIVPAKVTDENGSIKPGDLLVTSSTSGRAMRADKNPPQGSVIGKALEKLESGTGMIKILAVLQ